MRKPRVFRPVVLAMLMLAMPATPALARQGWSFDGEAGAGFDSNVGNAASTSDDVRTAATFDAGVGASYDHPFSLYTALQFRGGLAAQTFSGLEKLTNGLVTTRVRLLHKPGEGFYVPVLGSWISAGYRESASSLRSGAEWRAGVYVIEPLTTQVQARLGGAWLKRDASSRVFDGNVSSAEFNVDWAPAPRVTIYGGYRMDWGPIVVSAENAHPATTIAPKSEHLVLMNLADRIEQDSAFGEDWWAFRVHGRTGIATLGTNILLSRDVSLDVQVREAHATVSYDGAYSGGGPGPSSGASYSPGYDRWLAGASLLFRF